VHISAEPVSNKIASQQNAGVRSSVPLAPGTLRSDKNALFVVCGGATEVRVLSVKREGGKSVDVVQFLHGVRLTDGERFGNS